MRFPVADFVGAAPFHQTVPVVVLALPTASTELAWVAALEEVRGAGLVHAQAGAVWRAPADRLRLRVRDGRVLFASDERYVFPDGGEPPAGGDGT